MYNDDGITQNAFEKGNYELLEFEAELSKRFLEIDFEAEFGKQWNPSEKEITLVIHNIDWKPKKIKINGKRKQFSTENNILSIPLKWNSNKELKIKVSLRE